MWPFLHDRLHNRWFMVFNATFNNISVIWQYFTIKTFLCHIILTITVFLCYIRLLTYCVIVSPVICVLFICLVSWRDQSTLVTLQWWVPVHPIPGPGFRTPYFMFFLYSMVLGERCLFVLFNIGRIVGHHCLLSFHNCSKRSFMRRFLIYLI